MGEELKEMGLGNKVSKGGHALQYKGGRDGNYNCTCILGHLIISVLQAVCHVLVVLGVTLGHHRR